MGLFPAQVQRLLATGRVPGAWKHGRAMDASGGRGEAATAPGEETAGRSAVARLARCDRGHRRAHAGAWPDTILDSVREERLRLIYEASSLFSR